MAEAKALRDSSTFSSAATKAVRVLYDACMCVCAYLSTFSSVRLWISEEDMNKV